MAAHRWMTFTALSLTLFTLVGCGSTSPTIRTASTASVQATSTRPTPPKLSAAKATESYASSEARRLAADALYRYEDLRRDWFNAAGDYDKDRIEQQMVTVLANGLQDVRHATSGSFTTDGQQIYSVATRALERHEGLRRDLQYAYGDRERRQIVNDMLTVLTTALMNIRDR